jgi:uncharacterized surface protein with fasciclin (FAS1) repeats
VTQGNSPKDIVTNLAGTPSLSTLATVVQTSGLTSTLQGPGPFTVFAPDNSAFAKLPAGTVEDLVKPENKAKLTSILTYHVVLGTYKTTDLKDGQILKTVSGKDLVVKIVNGKIMINNATILVPDILQSNGVANIIDIVLIPS